MSMWSVGPLRKPFVFPPKPWHFYSSHEDDKLFFGARNDFKRNLREHCMVEAASGGEFRVYRGYTRPIRGWLKVIYQVYMAYVVRFPPW